MEALSELFSYLPGGFPLPIIVVQHLHPTGEGYLYDYLNDRCALTVKEAGDKESIRPGHIYFAPPDYHLLVERDETLALSIDEKVNYARPSIDVLFESAAHVWSSDLIGVILTGVNHDGARGLRLIREYGGLTIAQDPATAEYPVMPQAAIDAGGVDRILPLDEIGGFLSTLKAPR
jgi:two-component system chemotaxis response regulator CheB